MRIAGTRQRGLGQLIEQRPSRKVVSLRLRAIEAEAANDERAATDAAMNFGDGRFEGYREGRAAVWREERTNG